MVDMSGRRNRARPSGYDERIQVNTGRAGRAGVAIVIPDDACPYRFTPLTVEQGRHLNGTLRSVLRGDWNHLLRP